MNRAWGVLACVALLAAPVAAKSLAGKNFPATVKAGDKTLKLNGVGMRKATMFKVKVYAAGLYVEETAKDAKAILGKDQAWRLDLKFVRDVDQEKMAEAFVEGFDKNGHKGQMAGAKKLGAMLGDMADNDVLSFAYVPGKGVTVKHNGKRKGSIAGAKFAQALLTVWLGKEPPNPELKEGLLAGG